MLQAHSFLWNYLWVAPNILLFALAVLLSSRGIARQYPGFVTFAILSSLGGLAVFVADISPFVSPINYWRVDWASLLTESLLKFVVIGEVLARVLKPYSSVGRLGRIAVSGAGGTLVLVAAVVAGLSRGDSTVRLISGFHLLEQTVFVIELGLIVVIFLFASYFRLSWDRRSFGILVGFGISACVYLFTWAIVSNADPSDRGRTLLSFLNMGTYHFSVLLWSYYLLVPQKSKKPVLPLPENNLEVWNRELEHLLH